MYCLHTWGVFDTGLVSIQEREYVELRRSGTSCVCVCVCVLVWVSYAYLATYLFTPSLIDNKYVCSHEFALVNARSCFIKVYMTVFVCVFVVTVQKSGGRARSESTIRSCSHKL